MHSSLLNHRSNDMPLLIANVILFYWFQRIAWFVITSYTVYESEILAYWSCKVSSCFIHRLLLYNLHHFCVKSVHRLNSFSISLTSNDQDISIRQHDALMPTNPVPLDLNLLPPAQLPLVAHYPFPNHPDLPLGTSLQAHLSTQLAIRQSCPRSLFLNMYHDSITDNDLSLLIAQHCYF